jgi:hypothetical protein
MSNVSARPSACAIATDVLPLIEGIPFYGPPTVFLAVPWLLFALLLAGPFVLLVTVVIALLTAGVLIAAVAAIVASPFLLVRHLRSHHHAVAPVAADRPHMPKSVPAAGY